MRYAIEALMHENYEWNKVKVKFTPKNVWYHDPEDGIIKITFASVEAPMHLKQEDEVVDICMNKFHVMRFFNMFFFYKEWVFFCSFK